MSATHGRRALPAGSVTFLFTDIEGSTRLWERAAEAMRRALARHDGIVRKSVERAGGIVFKNVGDSFFCVFERPAAALRASIDLQYALINEPWPRSVGELRVRVALHTGNVVLRRGDYFGPTVDRAARLTAAAHGGQILVSSATEVLLRGHLGEVELHDLGTHRLKDLGDPEPIFQVASPQLPAEVRMPAELDTTPNNLPAQISSFVGRAKELGSLKSLVHKHRLVTITGLGGIGKTRLALQLASGLLRDYKDGCWFVALEEKDEPALIVQATADALRVRGNPSEPLEQTLLEVLYDKKALIVLDNAEHLLEGVAAFARRLLETAAEVRVVVTSREQLHVSGERVFRLGGIDEGVSLFLDRAREVRPDLDETGDGFTAAASICTKLQGIPLAIELAAARCAALTAAQLDEAVSAHLLLESQGEGEEGQSPLAAMLDWSYKLLKASEKRFLARLAIFEASFTLEAASTVALDEPSDAKAVALLASLVDKSLVTVATDEDEARYCLLDVVREFALERLREFGDTKSVEHRFCRYYVRLAQSIADSEVTRDTRVASVAADWGNLRATLRLALDERLDHEAGRLIVKTLAEFWIYTGRTTEGWHWTNRALEGADVPRAMRAELLERAAQLASTRGDYAAVEPLAKLLVEMHERSGDAASLGKALQLLSNAKLNLGNGIEAEKYQRKALDQLRAIGDSRGIAFALANLGTIALRYHQNPSAARMLYTHALEIFTELGDSHRCAEILGNLSVASMQTADYVHALKYSGAALSIFQRSGDSEGIANQHINLAEIYVEQRMAEAALAELRLARKALGDQPHRILLAYYFEAVFKLAVEMRSYRRAAMICGFAEKYRHLTRVPLQPSEAAPIESRRAILMKEFGVPALERLMRDGAKLDVPAVEGLIERVESAPHRPSTVS